MAIEFSWAGDGVGFTKTREALSGLREQVEIDTPSTQELGPARKAERFNLWQARAAVKASKALSGVKVLKRQTA